MPHDMSLITTIAVGLGLALVFGFLGRFALETTVPESAPTALEESGSK